jgi:uncharacterized membrane protein
MDQELQEDQVVEEGQDGIVHMLQEEQEIHHQLAHHKEM